MKYGILLRYKSYRAGFMAILLVILAAWPALSDAQNIPLPGTAGAEKRPDIVLTGSVGVYGELYERSSGASYRPGSTGRIFFRPTLSMYRSFSISTDILLSTEGNSNRQNINQLDFNPRWGWGSAHAGDFTESYSSLTLNGIRIRGGGLTINPRKFRFSVVAGRTRRATSNSSADRSYSRTLYGGRIGVGKREGSWIDLIFLRSKDKASSLPPLEQSDGVVDSAETQIGANPWSRYPEDNLVAAISSDLRLFDRKLSWQNELSGSAFTRNTEGQRLTDEDIPSWVDRIFKVHVGTRADIAYKTEIDYSSGGWSLSTGYQLIGPGYSSLGLSSLMADRQAFLLGGAMRRKIWMVNINGSRENDNLVDQKTYTTVRNRINGTVNFRPYGWWNIGLTGNWINTANDSPSDTTMLDNTNIVFGLNQVFTIGGDGRFKSVSANFVIQRSSDDNPLRRASRMRAQNVDLRATIKAASRITITPAIGLAVSKIGDNDSKTTTTLVVSAQYGAPAGKFTSGLTLGPSFSDNSRLFKAALFSAYKITRLDQVQSDLKYNVFDGGQNESDHNEVQWGLSATHRF